jgi:hypothetical protein
MIQPGARQWLAAARSEVSPLAATCPKGSFRYDGKVGRRFRDRSFLLCSRHDCQKPTRTASILQAQFAANGRSQRRDATLFQYVRQKFRDKVREWTG